MAEELSLERRMELFEYIRTNMSITLSVDSDYEGCSEYASFSTSIHLTNPETGKSEEIASDYGSVCINSD